MEPRDVGCLSLLLIAGVAQAAANVGTVTGKVVDAAGRGNEGVKVTILSGDKELGVSYTDSDGKFKVENVKAASGCTVSAVRTLRGLSMSGKKDGVSIKEGKTTDVGDIQIQVGGAG